MTLVKVCGLTRERDVCRAVELGAAACGFVLSASPRQVTPARAGALSAETAGILSVGVVTTEPAEWIAAACEDGETVSVASWAAAGDADNIAGADAQFLHRSGTLGNFAF